MLNTYSHSTCATARLFCLKSLFSKGDKHIIITDSDSDIDLLRSFAKVILGKNIHILHALGEFWMMHEATTGIYCIPTSLLETHGDLGYLQKHSLYEIARNTHQTIEETIEKLIDFGYTHAIHLGEFATYRREGSIVTITDAHTGNTILIEWFDTEIDSIIEIDARTDERRYRDSVTIKNQKLENTPIERKIGTINPDLLKLVASNKGGDIILIGGDFLPYIETLREIANIHYTDFHRDDSISLAVDIPTIHHIDEFLAFLREYSEREIHIYTKFAKTVGEFIEFHQLKNIQIIEVQKGGMESFIINRLPVPEKIEKQKIEIPKKNTIGLVSFSAGEFGGSISEDSRKKSQTVGTRCSLERESFGDLENQTVNRSQNESEEIKTFGTFSHKSTEIMQTFIITDDIIGNIFVRTRNKKSIAKHLDLLLSLKPGDLVVHREHGIALFHAVTKKNTGNLDREYLELHYAEGDKLFVPLTEIYRVSKYLGKPDVELTKLSGKEWERTMEKTTEEIEAIAQDILETNARRSLAKGRAFAKFHDKEIEFKKAFSYEYTDDQSRAIDEIFEDMESEAAMDRLISGDVGFGKTEVAMNAIYKAVLSGTQVAVISPLLVLADEHYETFIDRLGPFGVRIGIMTRMNSAKEIAQTLEELRSGNIDIVVGTHRLLSEDVKYKKLGLLVIDEEHKFGVTHKERIKKIRAGIDILALSATPIPRSLNLALSGLKKISIIATPPKKKKPIETIITRWDESVIAHAIRYEIERGGQVIILHNRIRGMESLAKEIEEIMKIVEGGKEIVESGKWKVESDDKSTGGNRGNNFSDLGFPLDKGGKGDFLDFRKKHIPYNSNNQEYARKLRNEMTNAEKKLWIFLRNTNERWLRQKPLDNYIVDFYCSEYQLVIEIDGETHGSNEQKQYDQQRTHILESYGLLIIRFSNIEVYETFEGVCEKIIEVMEERKQNPPSPLRYNSPLEVRTQNLYQGGTKPPLSPLSIGSDTKNLGTSQKQRVRGGKIFSKGVSGFGNDGEINFSNKEIGCFSEVPRIIITHGQMPGDQIEDRIHAFKKGEYDILLSTTIIENGVNFLSTNTIIIIDPEEFGLASLHQLRGRVGRKDIDAYCYLMYRKPELGKEEKERLITIANNTHLGAGFEIAMRDMEIRGAGDVLGIKQSGRSKDIGLTLYFRLLEERIAELRDEKKRRVLTKIELDLSYILPEEYFLSEADKLNFFREIENLETLEELEEMEGEVQSEKYKVKSGNNTPDSSFSNLFLLIRTRLVLSEYHVTKLSKIGMNYVFDLSDTSTVDDTKRFLERFDIEKRMVLLSTKKIRVETRYWKQIEYFLQDITSS